MAYISINNSGSSVKLTRVPVDLKQYCTYQFPSGWKYYSEDEKSFILKEANGDHFQIFDKETKSFLSEEPYDYITFHKGGKSGLYVFKRGNYIGLIKDKKEFWVLSDTNTEYELLDENNENFICIIKREGENTFYKYYNLNGTLLLSLKMFYSGDTNLIEWSLDNDTNDTIVGWDIKFSEFGGVYFYNKPGTSFSCLVRFDNEGKIIEEQRLSYIISSIYSCEESYCIFYIESSQIYIKYYYETKEIEELTRIPRSNSDNNNEPLSPSPISWLPNITELEKIPGFYNKSDITYENKYNIEVLFGDEEGVLLRLTPKFGPKLSKYYLIDKNLNIIFKLCDRLETENIHFCYYKNGILYYNYSDTASVCFINNENDSIWLRNTHFKGSCWNSFVLNPEFVTDNLLVLESASGRNRKYGLYDPKRDFWIQPTFSEYRVIPDKGLLLTLDDEDATYTQVFISFEDLYKVPEKFSLRISAYDTEKEELTIEFSTREECKAFIDSYNQHLEIAGIDKIFKCSMNYLYSESYLLGSFAQEALKAMKPSHEIPLNMSFVLSPQSRQQ